MTCAALSGLIPSSGLNWILTPASFWIFLIISPFLPMTIPTTNLGTDTSILPPPAREVKSLRTPRKSAWSFSRMISKTISFACCTLNGSPVMRRGLSAPVGSGPSWIMTIFTPVRSCNCLIVSPPLPMTSPTLDAGIRSSWIVLLPSISL